MKRLELETNRTNLYEIIKILKYVIQHLEVIMIILMKTSNWNVTIWRAVHIA